MTLTIEELETAHRNFYAPAFDVVVSDLSLVRQLNLEVTSVQVDNNLGGADRFSFVVNNGFDIKKREFVKAAGKSLLKFFEFGAPVEIHMGYADRTNLTAMLAGIVTEISTSFPSSGLPQITVSGYDHSYCLTKGTASKNWQNKKDSDVVKEIAKLYNLTPKVQDTGIPQPQIERSQESAFQFLGRLAKRNGFEFFVNQKDLVFRKPSNDERGTVQLEWGRGLVSFSPEINLGEQVTEVEVYGWNVQAKQTTLGAARRGDEPGRDPSRQSGAEVLQRICRDNAKLRVRLPVHSREQANREAEAILKRRAEGFVGGRGESIGIPELKADTNVTFVGLGEVFDTTFYVQQTTHTVDSSGYKTTFQVKDTTI